MSSINGTKTKDSNIQAEYRRLPSVDALLQHPEVASLISMHGEKLVTDTVRALIADARTTIAQGGNAPGKDTWLTLLNDQLAKVSQPLLRPVINATGVILHTNLGRAPLSAAARQAVASVTRDFNNLEYDLDSGKRGSRYNHAREWLTQLTGAEDALVVNNCASAVFLALTALCRDLEVVVSRGQLVEIGGGFRIPDVLRQSGAHLVEVGTTNRTHPHDFEAAITPRTGALMRIHASNFRLMGFVTMPELSELVQIAHAAHANQVGQSDSNLDNRPLVIDDLGSGTFLETHPYGLTPEPTVQESVAAGADVVAFSGDKLLGGPQAGILVGRQSCIEQLRKHPLARALRVDKMTLAALEATLRSYATGRATEEIPVWQMISASKDQMADTAKAWQRKLTDAYIQSLLWVGESAIGGGSLPGETLPTTLLAIPLNARQNGEQYGDQNGYKNECQQPDAAAAYLRTCNPPIVCRIQQDHLVFDPRTVLPGQEEALLDGIRGIFH